MAIHLTELKQGDVIVMFINTASLSKEKQDELQDALQATFPQYGGMILDTGVDLHIVRSVS